MELGVDQERTGPETVNETGTVTNTESSSKIGNCTGTGSGKLRLQVDCDKD